MMRKVAFKLFLKDGVFDEYKRRHDTIWPELVDLLRQAGISDYSIFVDEDQKTLFAVQVQADSYSDAELRAHPIMQRWWDYMADLMEVEDDRSPCTTPLSPVFYLE